MYNNLQSYRLTRPKKLKEKCIWSVALTSTLTLQGLIKELQNASERQGMADIGYVTKGTRVDIDEYDSALEVCQIMEETDSAYNIRMMEEFEKDEGRLKDAAKAIKNMLSETEAKIEQTEIDQMRKLADKYEFKLVRN